MKKLILKSALYLLLIVVLLEILVRIFHLGKDNPSRFLDENKVEKWKPNQTGFSVTGNRRQNFSEYHINNSGFNSYREFTPTKDKYELAIVGDSFIEGFHQNYNNSIGKKIENKIPEIEVYEYGYAGYDYADQMHLIHQYKNEFNLIDKVIIRISFNDDFTRSEYKVLTERLNLEKGPSKFLKKSKLMVYAKSIGIFTPVKDFVKKVTSFRKNKTVIPKKNAVQLQKEKVQKYTQYITNFETLNNTYHFNKEKFTLLLDSKTTPDIFINHLQKNKYSFIDIRPAFDSKTANKTLIYDQHWNNLGRQLIAEEIYEYLNTVN